MATKRKPSKKKPSALACKRRGRALAKKRTAKAGKSLAACRRPARKPAARKASRNGRAKYGYYVVDKLTGLVHAGNEFREDAVDERKAMIEEGVPAGRVAVMTAASVRSKFGAIKWGTGRPDVRESARNGT